MNERPREEREREELSPEETDMIVQSNKKVKTGDSSGMEIGESQMEMVPSTFPVFYRSKLVGADLNENMEDDAGGEDIPPLEDAANVDESDDGSQPDMNVGEKSTRPMLKVSKEEYASWCKPWNLTLLVKLTGKTVGVNFMKNLLEKLWNRHGLGKMQIIDLPEGFFAVSFATLEEYNYAYHEGPWLVADHYLIVQKWRPNFIPLVDNVTKIAAWVRVPKLPLEYYNARALWRVGNLIGRTLKVDTTTSLTSRGKFARLCVEINLEQKLVPQVEIMGLSYGVEYEGLHLICFQCGRYGHVKDSCVHNVIHNTEQVEVTTGVGREMPQSSDGAPQVAARSEGEVDGGAAAAEETEIYGPWMMVKRQVQRKPQNQRNAVTKILPVPEKSEGRNRMGGNKEGGSNSSRFNVLREIDTNQEPIVTNGGKDHQVGPKNMGHGSRIKQGAAKSLKPTKCVQASNI